MNHGDVSTISCDGWWEQSGWGRQPMLELQLAYANGCIQGSGVDVVGRFTMAGQVAPDGVVAIRKHYVGRHTVNYYGTSDGEGTLAGEWEIDGWRGAWSIAFRRDRGISDQVRDLTAD